MPADPGFGYSASAARPLIEYRLVHRMLEGADPQPLLRVWGDGRVQVHVPVYMKRAGDYEMHLSRAQLDNLLASLAGDGLMEFDSAAERARLRQLKAQQAAGGAFYEVSDETLTQITLSLDFYRRDPQSPPVEGLLKQFSWRNLEQDARRFPQLRSLRGAQAGAARLHRLLSDPALGKQ